MNARALVNNYLFGGQHEEIIALIERQEAAIERLRAAVDSPFRCPACGHMIDTPQHELGCVDATASAPLRQRDER